MYDDRDYDDVIGMVTDGAGLNDAHAQRFVQAPTVGNVHPVVRRLTASAITRRQATRAPPTEASDTYDALPLRSAAPNSRAAERGHPHDRSTADSSLC